MSHCSVLQLVLFPPEDLSNLYYVGRPKGLLQYSYPNSFQRHRSNVDVRGFLFGSSVNVDKPDLTRHPLYKNASPYRVLLKPGDVLYLPPFWHHEVQSLPDPVTGLNVAVNFWFENVTAPVHNM